MNSGHFLKYSSLFVPKLLVYDKKYLQYNKKYLQYNKKYLQYNKKYLQYNKKYLQYNKKYLQYNTAACVQNKLGRLMSESACEQKDPGSNPAADMVDAARNTAWDLGCDEYLGTPVMARRNDGDRKSLPRLPPEPSQSAAASASDSAAARPITASAGPQPVSEHPHKSRRNSKSKDIKKHTDPPPRSASPQMQVTYDAVESDIQIVRPTKKESRADMTPYTAKASSQNAHAWKRKKRRSSKDIFSAPVGKVKYVGEDTMCTQSLISGLISIVLTVFLSVPISLLVLLTLPMAVIVKTLGTACFHPRLPSCGNHEYLSAHDAHFFSQSTQSVLHSILIVDGILPLARVRQVVSARVIEAKNGSGELLFPRFTSRVRKLPFGPAWEPDRSFHMHHHIYLGPRLNSKEELQNYVSDVLSKPLSLDRPLWEVIVVGGGKQDGIRDTVLVCRIHPCIGDGISLMRVLCQALSDNHVQHLPPKPHFGATTYATSVMQAFFSAPLMIIRWLWWWPKEHNLLTDSHYFVKKSSLHSNQVCNSVPHSLQSNDRKCDYSNKSSVQNHYQHPGGVQTHPRHRCSLTTKGHVVRWSAGVSLAKVTRVKLVTRTCLNDVLLAALAGALRKIMQKRGLHNPSDLMVSTPTSCGMSSRQPGGVGQQADFYYSTEAAHGIVLFLLRKPDPAA
ncbi:O-acyltransferase WSD1 N-terminal [Trinorchestia longiramus]|nr:O-acyltransferase WSD1 N-terminal [Trinorchestia longiramus]